LMQKHGVPAAESVLVGAGSIPQTTSGNLQCSFCRTRFAANELPVLYRRGGDNEASLPSFADNRLARLLRVLGQVTGQSVDDVTPAMPLNQLGLDSIPRVRLRLALEIEFGLPTETEGRPPDETVQGLLDLLPPDQSEPVSRPDVALPRLDFESSSAEVTEQARVWRRLWHEYTSFQDITHLRHDSPVQLLR